MPELAAVPAVAYLAIGVLMGFLAGLLGIGGGGAMVPMLLFMFEREGFPRESIMHVCVATAMSTVVFTSVSSLRAHAKRGAVRWDALKGMLPGIVVGGLVGTWIAGRLSTFGLALFFTVFIYLMAANLLIGGKPKGGRSLPGTAVLFFVGFVISAVSALVAIGGAMMTVPFLVWCEVPLVHAIGTSSAVGLPVALASTIGYIYTGLHQTGLPPHTVGYVYWPATLIIAAASVCTAPLGARVAHAIKTEKLRKLFALFLFALATRMLWQLW
jgi:uncharacterized membrane protein YfcA